MKKILLIITAVASISHISCKADSKKGLAKEESKEIITTLISQRDQMIVERYGSDWDNDIISNGEYSMPFFYKVFGKEVPEDGRAMYISMHGGGGTTQEFNNGQWDNQKRLYTPSEGVYFVPRAPTNSWDLWHQAHIDHMIEKAIAFAIIKEGVNPNKVYIMGYSAGGDGTYQLAPRLADLFAGAAMSAGHPGDAHMDNLRNLPFAIFMGGKDDAYNRNNLAAVYGGRLDSLKQRDNGGYEHLVKIYPEHGHWMQHDDTISMSWLPKFKRNPIPERVVWLQDDVARKNFYWLEATADGMAQNSKIVATYNSANNRVDIIETDVNSLIVGLNDSMMDLDKPISIYYNGKEIFNGDVERKKESIVSDIDAMRDRELIFPVKMLINIDRQKATASQI